MKQVIFEYVKWQHNSGTIYSALNDPKLRPATPTVIGLIDGFTVICIPHNDNTLSPMTMSFGPQFAVEVSEPLPVTEVVLEKPVVTGISENTLLRALAIAQDPTLALELIKD